MIGIGTFGLRRKLGIVGGAILFLSGPSLGQEGLLLSLDGEVSMTSGSLMALEDEDLLLFTPFHGTEPGLYLSDLNWETLVGDGDGDGTFDDEPVDVDALWIDPGASFDSVFDLWISFSSDRRFASGEVARDGDVIQLTPDGGFLTIFGEDFFASLTSTSAIDIDAFAMTPQGDLVFSFSENEVTSSASLMAQNGGSDDLPDGTVFIFESGTAEAIIWYSEEDLRATVSRALASTVTSISDLQGLALDPSHPGDILFAVSSRSSGVEGTVFTTFDDGQVAVLDGHVLDGSSFGYDDEEPITALCVVSGRRAGLAILVDSPDVSVSQSTELAIDIVQGRPMATVQIVMSGAMPPVIAGIRDPRLSGAGHLFVDPASPLTRSTARSQRYRVALDVNGRGRLVLPIQGAVPGIVRVIQAFDRQSLEASYAIVVESVD